MRETTKHIATRKTKTSFLTHKKRIVRFQGPSSKKTVIGNSLKVFSDRGSTRSLTLFSFFLIQKKRVLSATDLVKAIDTNVMFR